MVVVANVADAGGMTTACTGVAMHAEFEFNANRGHPVTLSVMPESDHIACDILEPVRRTQRRVGVSDRRR